MKKYVILLIVGVDKSFIYLLKCVVIKALTLYFTSMPIVF